jgi:glycosyltransferase involved in cell wall biosynthesis
MTQVPILIISDAVSSSTGLGRIAREIAVRAAEHLQDVCRIATLGYGGPGSRRFNFQQYHIEGMGNDFILPTLPEVWGDWAGNEPGVIFTIWDASRLGWFSRPNVADWGLPLPLKTFLTTGKFKRWIYAPVDAEGSCGKLAYPLAQALFGFDRILTYSVWAEKIIRKTLGADNIFGLGSIPHGIDPAVFHERGRVNSRINFLKATQSVPLHGHASAIMPDELLIGTVATNQARKDWALWAESCRLFLNRHPKARFWVHTDTLERHWSIPAMLVDYGLVDRTLISLGYIEDDQMATAYTACDLTLGIGSGEGFGYPIFESLFCGTPCIHGNYGGAPEHMGEHLLVNPVAYRYEGLYCSKRPVFLAQDWADKMDKLLTKRVNRPGELDWTVVWPRFEAWFRKGVAGEK